MFLSLVIYQNLIYIYSKKNINMEYVFVIVTPTRNYNEKSSSKWPTLWIYFVNIEHYI